MSGRSKRAWSPDRFSGSPSSPGWKAVESGAGNGSLAQGPPRGAEDVETLVGDFLKELDALATEIGHGPAARSEKQPKVVAAQVITRDAAPPEPTAARAEEEIPREGEPGRMSEIDAELARALEELELQQKSNVVAPPSGVTRAAAAGPESDATPESGAGPVVEARPATAAGEAAGAAPQPERVLFSSAGLSNPGRRIWKPVIRAAAVVFLAGAAFALYRLLPVAPNAAAPSSPPAGPSAVKRQIAPGPAAMSPQALENAGITEAPETSAPKPVTSAAKPSKAPAARTAEPDRTPARPAESPAPKRNSAAPEPPASQAVPPEPARANRAPVAAPEPPPAAPQQVPAQAAEARAAAAQTEPAVSVSANPPEAQAPPPANPAPQAVPPPQAAVQEAARSVTETVLPEAGRANVPPASAPGPGAKEAAASPPSPTPPATAYTPPVAVSKVTPDYPALARRSKTTGTVEVEVQVDEQGKVVKATALSGPVLLRAAAEDALKRWVFKPAVRNGVNVRGVVRISVVFRE